jgi:hypothetical protein
MPGVSFGDLRSLAQRPPSKPVWATLCAMIESWPDPDERDALASPYVLGLLDRAWPDDLRVVPGRWLYERASSRPHYLHWGRTLALSARDLRLVGSGHATWPMHDFPWAAITRVRLQMGDLSPKALAPLGGPVFDGLTALSFTSSAPGALELLESMGRAGALSGLELLELATPGVRVEVANLVLEHADLPNLRALHLTRSAPKHATTSTLDGNALAHRVAQSPAAPRLTSLALRFVQLGDVGARALARAPLHALEHLDLCGNALSERGLDALLSSRWGRRGVPVDVRGCPALDPDVDLLTRVTLLDPT